jgi:hypothetical protein
VPRHRRARAVAPPPATALAAFRLPADHGRGRREIVVLRIATATPYGWFRNPFPVLVLLALLAIENPLKYLEWVNLSEPLPTYFLIALWLWCGWGWTRRKFACGARSAGGVPETEMARSSTPHSALRTPQFNGPDPSARPASPPRPARA